MNSILANIFLEIQARILAEVPEVKWIDQDLGQLEFYDRERPPVLFPAVLIDIPSATYSDAGQYSQLAETTLEIRLAVAAYKQASHVHSLQHREKALEYYNIEHKLNQVLHGWSNSQFFSSLSRTGSITERREDNIRVRSLRYALTFSDSTAMPVTTSVPKPEMELSV
jgi:hypothetical protein